MEFKLKEFGALIIALAGLMYWFAALSTIEIELTKYSLVALTLLTIASFVWVANK